MTRIKICWLSYEYSIPWDRELKEDKHNSFENLIYLSVSAQSFINSSATYEGCSKNNASHFIMLAHDARGRCWWYGCRGWTFPPVFCYVLLPCDIWQQRGSLIEWHLTWKCIWSKGVSLNFCMLKKWHPHRLTFIDGADF